MTPPRRIPTKAELLRLQRQFKTDARIAERLGNVTPYLVSYWRRKRNVPNYSSPKFSEKDIHILWERFGDDDRCGAELGVSKAAFYSWRRRYGIKSKPAFLKLEQMEIEFPGDGVNRSVTSNTGTRPATHKLIFNSSTNAKTPSNGSLKSKLTIAPDLVVIDNATDKSLTNFIASDGKINLPIDRLAFLMNGKSESKNGSGANSSSKQNGNIFDWIKKRQIRQVFSMVDGNMWEALYESGQVLPGQLIACQRGFERFAGAIGALGWWTAGSELVNLFETGKVDLPALDVVRISITGKRYAPISATDILINLAANLSDKDYANTAIEYSGSALMSMPIVDRQTLCAIGSMIDVRSALTPCDSLTMRHVTTLGNWKFDHIAPDRDADFIDSYQINIESVKPMVAIRHANSGSGVASQSQLLLDSDTTQIDSGLIDVATNETKSTEVAARNGTSVGSAVSFHTAQELEQIEVDVVFIGGSPGGHYESLRKAAEALHGKKVAGNVRLLVSPISQRVYLRCLKRGVLRQLIESGAIILNPGIDSSALGAFGISPKAKVVTASIEPLFSSIEYAVDRYIVSPLTAAVSASTGHLLDPRGN